MMPWAGEFWVPREVPPREVPDGTRSGADFVDPVDSWRGNIPLSLLKDVEADLLMTKEEEGEEGMEESMEG